MGILKEGDKIGGGLNKPEFLDLGNQFPKVEALAPSAQYDSGMAQ